MRDTNRAEMLLSLFTSPDCAAAMAGDLTEERQHRGRTWWFAKNDEVVARHW